ncbi:protein chromatin remodeling 8 [Galdieria sulphuraria]|nr:protein chromatin remodeling 8 [Galdieria sulphuraria]
MSQSFLTQGTERVETGILDWKNAEDAEREVIENFADTTKKRLEREEESLIAKYQKQREVVVQRYEEIRIQYQLLHSESSVKSQEEEQFGKQLNSLSRLLKRIDAERTEALATFERKKRKLLSSASCLVGESTSELDETGIVDLEAPKDSELATAVKLGQVTPFQGQSELEKTVMNHTSKEDVCFDGGLRLPADIYDRLFPYQQVGVQWLWELHCQGVGGIVGDEMGLGKTIQVIVLLASLSYSHLLPGPVCIVAPATLLSQWKREFATWWPSFRVRIMHKSAGDGDLWIVEDIIEQGDILVTSYEQVRRFHEYILVHKWDYVILDEGHRIRNPDAEITLVCKRFKTVHRIIMTGAPLQNRLKELWSLFDFVYPGKLGTLPVFEEQFSVPITLGSYLNATPLQVHTAYKCASVLRNLVSPYLLRRLKKDVALQLPKKQEQILFCKLTKEQRELYKKYLNSRELQKVLQGSVNMLTAVSVLRKICNHPDLYDENALEDDRRYGEWTRAGKLVVLDQVLLSWSKDDSRVLIFSQSRAMLDILEMFARQRRYTYLRMDGETAMQERMKLIDSFNQDDEVFLFLLTTKVGGLGINLTGANRVVLYDPDWNPSTDLQARERAWRIGQKRDVIIYRLVTSGTIEEKIYHRQIFKQLLTNKVLKDAQQTRFFRPKDLFDLFTLGDEYEDGTETGDLFSEDCAESDKDNCIESTNETRLLKELLDGKSLHSAMDHDAVLDVLGNDALENLRKSRVARQQSSIFMPTWTGNAGEAGALSVPRFGRVKATSVTPSRKESLDNEKYTNSSSEILRDIRKQSLGVVGGELKSQGNRHVMLMEELCQFLRQRQGKATTTEIVSTFREQISSDALLIFKQLLKQVATKTCEESGALVWSLKEEFY